MAQGQEIDQLFVTLGANTAPLVAGVGQAQGVLRKFSSFLKTPIGAMGALGAITAIVGAKATAMAAEFDKALREVSTLLPKTVDDMGRLRDAITELSTRVPEPPVQLTKGLYQIISAGITDTAKALGVLEVASKAATAGLADTLTAADAITTVLNAYQLEASEAARVSDVFFATIAEGKITFPEIAASIGNVATSAAQAGISIAEMGAAIATLTKFGIDSAEATSSLNRLVFSLIQNSEEAKQAQKDLGVEFNLTALRAKGLSKFLFDIAEGTNADIDALAKINPSIRSLRALLILAGDGMEEFNRILSVTENSLGATEIAFQKMQGSLDNQWKMLKNKVNVWWLELGEVTLPVVISAMETLNQLMSEQLGDVEKLSANMARVIARRLGGEFMPREAGDIFGFERLARIQNRLLSDPAFREAQLQQLQHAIAAADAAGRSTKQLVRQRTLLSTLNDLLATETRLLEESAAAAGGLADSLTEGQMALIAQLEQIEAGLTVTKVDDMLIQFQEVVDGIIEEFGRIPEEWQTRVLDPMLEEIQTQQLAETFAGEFQDIQDRMERLGGAGEAATTALIARFGILADNLRQQRDELELGSTRWRQLDALLRRVTEATKRLSDAEDKRNKGTKEGNKLSREQNQQLEETLRKVSLLARAFIDVAQAMGLATDEGARLLSSLVNIGVAVADIKTRGPTPENIGGLLGGLANLFSALGSGGQGPSAEELERRQALADNTAAIERLKDVMGDLADRIARGEPGIAVAGAAPALRAAMDEFMRRIAFGAKTGLPILDPFQTFLNLLGPELENVGLTMEELRAFAASLGITLDENVATYQQFLEAAEAIQVAKIFEGIAGQLALLRREFALFDRTPMEQVTALLGFLREFSDIEVPDFDIDTAGGRAAAEQFLQGLFDAMRANPEQFAAQLGTLSFNEFLDLIGSIESALDGLGDAAEDGVTRGFQVTRGITEVTGNRLAGLLTTDVFWNRMTAENTLAMVHALNAMEFLERGLQMAALAPRLTDQTPQPPPVIFADTAVNIEVSGAASPELTAQAVARTLTEQLDERLGEALMGRRRAGGRVPLPQGLT